MDTDISYIVVYHTIYMESDIHVDILWYLRHITYLFIVYSMIHEYQIQIYIYIYMKISYTIHTWMYLHIYHIPVISIFIL